MLTPRLRHLRESLLGSYWFTPGVMAGATLACAAAFPALDRNFDGGPLRGVLGVKITTESVEAMLGSIVTANVSIVGVVFSITILTLSIASSQLGPHLLRTFMADRVTHFALGLYLSTAMYCLILLVALHGGEPDTIPQVSVFLALAAAVFGLGFLIFFVQRIAQLIGTPNVVESVARDLDRTIDLLFPEPLEAAASDRSDDHVSPPCDAPAFPIRAEGEGYLQGVDIAALVAYGRKHALFVRFRFRPGQFVPRDAVLAEAWPRGDSPEKLTAHVNRACFYGNRRTLGQDLECAISELSQIAVRALSPGVNDPFTAINCIDRLGASLSRLARRRMPGPRHADEDGAVRLILPAESFSSALNTAFDQIRQYGRESVAVLVRIEESLRVVADAARLPDDRDAIRRQGAMVMRCADRHIAEKNDWADIKARCDALDAALDAPPDPATTGPARSR